MAFEREQIEQLSAKLDSGHVKKNPKGFDYVEGWHAIAEANRIFGFDGWSREMVNLKSLHEPYQNAKENWVVSYGCTVRITVRAGDAVVTRDGCGFGSGFSKDVGAAHESALKEAETDAMKRALMTFGNPFGLALYDKAQENVERTAKHEPATPPKAKGAGDDWQTVAEDIKREIDGALDVVAVRGILESKAFADLSHHSKKAAEFLAGRAEKRIGMIMQKRAA